MDINWQKYALKNCISPNFDWELNTVFVIRVACVLLVKPPACIYLDIDLLEFY